MAGESLLKAIRARQRKQTEFGYGILTADRYVGTLKEVIGLEGCCRYLPKGHISFDDLMKKASKTLVYSNPDMLLLEKKVSDQYEELAGKIDMPKNTLMVFRHVLTTSRKDRDGDVLRTEGLKVDSKMLLLWQHVHTMPIGKMLQEVEHNTKRLVLDSCIVDMNDLCHDSAVMVDNGMGRFSHGFRATKFDEIKADGDSLGGFDVKTGEIMEESLVSVPANVDAEAQEVLLSLVEGGKLTSPLMKRVGKSIRSHRAVQVQGVTIKYREQVGSAVRQLTCGSFDELKAAADFGLIGVKHENKSGDGSGEGKGGTKEVTTPEEADGEETVDEGTKEATDDEVKAYYGALDGSWEWIRKNLQEKISRYFASMGMPLGEGDWANVVATFPNYVVVSVENVKMTSDQCDYYKIDWTMKAGEPEFVGEPKEVELEVSTMIRERGILAFIKEMEKFQSMKPYPKEHAARQRDPGQFARILQIWPAKPNDPKDEPNYPYNSKWVRALGGPLKSDPQGAMQVQAVRFAKDHWTADEAKKWLKDNKFKAEGFEEASGGGKDMALDGEKLGRVLSKANEGKIREAKDNMDEVAAMDGVPKGGKALLREASSGLTTVLKSLGEDGGAPQEKEMTIEDAMTLVLAKASEDELNQMRNCLEALDKSNKAVKRVEAYVRAFGGMTEDSKKK